MLIPEPSPTGTQPTSSFLMYIHTSQTSFTGTPHLYLMYTQLTLPSLAHHISTLCTHSSLFLHWHTTSLPYVHTAHSSFTGTPHLYLMYTQLTIPSLAHHISLFLHWHTTSLPYVHTYSFTARYITSVPGVYPLGFSVLCSIINACLLDS